MIEQVSSLIRNVAAESILPRFKRLAAGDIQTKSPGEEVTVADREAESRLTRGLSSLVAGSVVVGEEAVERQPNLRNEVGQGVVWLVDPLDGTSNFIEGSTCYSTMVTLLRNGEAVASWMYTPATDVMHVAEKGSGATIDGVRIRSCVAPSWPELRGSVLTRFLPAHLRERILAHAGGCREILPGLRCAGEEYPAIARGMQNFALFWRALPWDHAPGVLFLQEAGGQASHFDGSAYEPSRPGLGILAAQTRELWADLQERLLVSDARP